MKADLAIHGGIKIRTNPMPARMAFGPDALQVIAELFDHYESRNLDFGFQDTYERLYTEAFVRYLDADGFADAICSGTAALFVAIAALQLPRDSHVIVSPITDPGTVSAIILNQLVPVVADARPHSYNMGVEQFVDRITDRTKAVVVVHAAGKAAKIDAITQIARERGLYVVEDCSQAHGAKRKGQNVGTFGDIAAFSTMYRKAHATGGCGGVIFTRDRAIYHLVRAYADRGKPFGAPYFDEKDPGAFLFPALNLNQDEISSAIGLKSLERLDDTIQSRLDFLQALDTSIEKSSHMCRLFPVSSDDSPFFHPVFVDVRKISCTKTEFAQAIQAEGISVNPHYKYVVSEWRWIQPYLADSFVCRNAIECRDSSFNILLNENYGAQEVEDVVAAIKKVERAYLI
jgi:dTDP-4-amino-4,6-dideoxygalactose transaminase